MNILVNPSFNEGKQLSYISHYDTLSISRRFNNNVENPKISKNCMEVHRVCFHTQNYRYSLTM